LLFDRELLAAFAAIRHFHFSVEGQKFTLLKDHKPLVTALKRVSPPWSVRQQQQLAYLADVRNCPGPDNTITDTLSSPCKYA
jgi:hypothetical protein